MANFAITYFYSYWSYSFSDSTPSLIILFLKFLWLDFLPAVCIQCTEFPGICWRPTPLKSEHRDTHVQPWTFKVTKLNLTSMVVFALLEAIPVGTKFSHQKLCAWIIQFTELKHDLYLGQPPAKLKYVLLLSLYFPSFPLPEPSFKSFSLLEISESNSLRDNSLRVSCVSTHLKSRGTDRFCCRLPSRMCV